MHLRARRVDSRLIGAADHCSKRPRFLPPPSPLTRQLLEWLVLSFASAVTRWPLQPWPKSTRRILRESSPSAKSPLQARFPRVGRYGFPSCQTSKLASNKSFHSAMITEQRPRPTRSNGKQDFFRRTRDFFLVIYLGNPRSWGYDWLRWSRYTKFRRRIMSEWGRMLGIP